MKRSPLIAVYLTVFLDLLGFGIILPLLPYYARHFGATGLEVGALMAAYSAAQFVGAPLMGRLSDNLGRRPVLLASLAGSAASLLLTGFADSLLWLITGRALAGLFGGSIATAQAYIADATEPKDRAKYMGLLGASIGMGFVLGPAMGASLIRFGFSTAAFVAASLAAANFIFALGVLTETRFRGSGVAPRARVTFKNLTDALGHPVIGKLLVAGFLLSMAFVGMEATFALLAKDRYGVDEAHLGWIFTYIGVVIAVVQGGLVGLLNRALGEQRLALTGALIVAAALFALPLSPTLWVLLAVMGFLAAGQGLSGPALSSLLSLNADPEEQGGTMGLNQSLAAASRAVGPIAAGWMYDHGADLPYTAGAALTLLGASVIFSIKTENRSKKTEARSPNE